MGVVDEMFPHMRDTKSNVMEEIQSVLFCSEVPLTIRTIRTVLIDRHNWVINLKTVDRFTEELVNIGKVVHVGKILLEGYSINGYTLSEREREIRRRSYSSNSVPDRWPVHERKGRDLDGDGT